jgi:Ni/Co efflux regulator RcnB
MNSKKIIAAIAAVCLLAGGAAFAKDKDHGDDRRDERGHQDNGRHGDNRGHERDNHERQSHNERDDHNNRYEERGAGPDHNFRRGERLPVYYRHPYYVVDDWRGHRLSAPPRGYHWVQTGSDYVLVAIATGIIFQILVNGN